VEADSLERLADSDDWDFFVDWIQKSRLRMEKEILDSNFTSDYNAYIYHRSALDVLKLVEQAIERFKRVRTQAIKQLGEVNDTIKGSING
jgi:hypothetical protein